MVKLKSKGNFNRTRNYLTKVHNSLDSVSMLTMLQYYGVQGCVELAKVTPTSTGKTAASWTPVVKVLGKDKYSLEWHNTNTRNGENIALLIELGYATKSGYRISGKKYIEPALEPVIDELERKIEEGVKKA